MSVIYLMLPGAFILAGLALWGFFKAAKQGQFDDLDSPSQRMLADDDQNPLGHDGASAQRPPRKR